MNSELSMVINFGEQRIQFLFKVPSKYRKVVKQILHEVEMNLKTALKAYDYKIVKQSKEE
jgi:hypothetical protein